MSNNEMINFFGEPISIYTRAQALEDGVLVDISEMAREAGFKIPVSVTSSVWNQYIDWNEKDSLKQVCQDLQGRLWDVLQMLMFAIKSNHFDTNSLNYKLNVIPRDGKSQYPKLIELKALINGGDNGDPVITIMLPNED